MPSQKIPLFNGLVEPVHVGVGVAVVTPIFQPPDKGSKAPQSYELHLWIQPNTRNVDEASKTSLDLTVLATRNPPGPPSQSGVLWRGTPFAGSASWQPIKVLDGVPVRGDVDISLLAVDPDALPDNYPLGTQMWGYYQRVGEGAQIGGERRFMGQHLDGFSEGIPLQFFLDAAAGGQTPKQVLHVFEKGRIDDVAITVDIARAAGTAEGAIQLSFEDVNGNPLIADHAVGLAGILQTTIPVFTVSNEARMHTQYSPYLFQGTFGGGDDRLHHISAFMTRQVANDALIGFAHGYFVRH